MKQVLIVIFIMTSCADKAQHIVDLCQIADAIYMERKKEFPALDKFIIVSEIPKINEITFIEYLKVNAKNFPDYDFTGYFSATEDSGNYSVSTCKMASVNISRVGSVQSTKPVTYQTSKMYIKFFRPIFNNDKTEFILLVCEYDGNLHSSFMLIVLDFKDGIANYKKTLLISN